MQIITKKYINKKPHNCGVILIPKLNMTRTQEKNLNPKVLLRHTSYNQDR